MLKIDNDNRIAIIYKLKHYLIANQTYKQNALIGKFELFKLVT